MPAAIPKQQFPPGLLVASLLVASGLLWAVMFFGHLAHLRQLAGGLTPFDIRPKGYSYADARAFLEAIGEEGRRYYAIPELVIDTFYPPLYAVSRGLALWWLTMPGRVREKPLPLKVRYALVAVPILMPLVLKLTKLVNDEEMSTDEKFLAFCRYHIGEQQLKLTELTGSHAEVEAAKQNLSEAGRLWDRQRAPLAWTRAEFVLGNLYLRAAESGGSTTALSEALARLKGSLAERGRLKVPGDWALTKMSLAWAHTIVSQRFSGFKAVFYLWRATKDCDEALEVLTIDGAAFNWAVAHNNPGIVYLRLAQLLQSRNPFLRTTIHLLFGMPDEAATRSLLQALRVFSLDNTPANWAMAKSNLSGAYLSRGIRQSNRSVLKSAIAAADEATRVFSRKNAPLRWAACATNRGAALAAIGEIDRDTTPLREATDTYRQAIEVLRAEGAKVPLENTEKNLAEAIQVLEGLSAH